MANKARLTIVSSLFLAALGVNLAVACSQQDTAASTKKAKSDGSGTGTGTSGTGTGTGSGPKSSDSPAATTGGSSGSGEGAGSLGASNEEIVVNPDGSGTGSAPPSGSETATGTASAEMPESGTTALINQLFLDILGRGAGDADIAFWEPKLTDAGADLAKRQAVARSIIVTPEGIKTTHARWFREWLGRNQDLATLKSGTGLDPFVANLAAGETYGDTAAYILGTDEFYAHSGSTIDGWLTAVYQIALGRGVDPAGRNLFVPRVAASSRQVVAKELLSSDEALTHLIAVWYKTYLLRDGDAVGIAEWKAKLVAGTRYNDPSVFALFLSTAEYYKRTGN